MGWRILQITKPCKLSVKNRQLLYEPFENDALTIPLEDVSVIILENKQILLSNALLSELPEYDVVLFTCDFSHLPSAVLFPFHTHSRYSQIAWLQQEISEPFKKTFMARNRQSEDQQSGSGVGNSKQTECC